MSPNGDTLSNCNIKARSGVAHLYGRGRNTLGQTQQEMPICGYRMLAMDQLYDLDTVTCIVVLIVSGARCALMRSRQARWVIDGNVPAKTFSSHGKSDVRYDH